VAMSARAISGHCKLQKCTQVIHPVKSKTFESSWVSCVAIDASESWLV
jgi:THO complex subunit 6